MLYQHLTFLTLASLTLAGQWDTYPQVPKTASINGFADPIYDELPKCARECVKASTGNTPCPYWDTGCLCVMPQWSGMVAQCIAEECSGKDVVSATSLAYGLCTEVGANVWMMPASITAALTKAAGAYNVAAPSATETAWDYLLDDDGDDDDDDDEDTTTTSSTKSSTKSSSESSTTASTTSASAETSDSSDETSSGDMGAKSATGILTVILGSLLAFIV